MDVRIHIEQLVLEGLEPADRQDLGAAVEWELGRLFHERGVPADLSGKHVAQVTAHGRDGSLQWHPEETRESIERQVAQGIYQGLGHHKGRSEG